VKEYNTKYNRYIYYNTINHFYILYNISILYQQQFSTLLLYHSLDMQYMHIQVGMHMCKFTFHLLI